MKVWTPNELKETSKKLNSISQERSKIRKDLIHFIRNNWLTTKELGLGQKKSYSDKNLIKYLNLILEYHEKKYFVNS